MKPTLKKTIAYTALAATLGLGLAFAGGGLGLESELDTDAPPPLVMDADIEVMLLRIGIKPDALAAAGLDSTVVQGAFAAEQSSLGQATGALADHDTACSALKVEVDALRRTVRSGDATDAEVTRLAVAKVELETATAARAAFLNSVCAQICEHFAPAAGTCVGQIAASKRWKAIPVMYRTQDRTEAQWVEIRNALSAKRTHEKAGLEVPAEVTHFLATLNGDQQVAAATSSCDTNLPGVDSMWHAVFEN